MQPQTKREGTEGDARQIIDAFRAHYNEVRPHSPLNYQPPAVFARKAAQYDLISSPELDRL